MRRERSAVSGAKAFAVAGLAALLLFVAYEVVAAPRSMSTSTGTPEQSTSASGGSPIITYSADAYATEAAGLLSAFSRSTGIPTAPVISGGSNADASSIAAGAPDDIFISASLSATSAQRLGDLSSNWAVGIATDQMVVAYSNATLTNGSASRVVNLGRIAVGSNATSDWNAFFESLVSGGVKVGISSPTADPAGVRAWLVLEAAGYLYAGGNQQAYGSSLLASGGNVTASSAASLVAPLQSGQIQFLFIYRSAATTDGLGYIPLDGHVNLSDPSLGSFYSRFSYTDSTGETTASPIVIVITVPLSSENAAEAYEFVQYVVKNMASLSAYGLSVPAQGLLYSNLSKTQSLPSSIQLMLSQGLLVQAGQV